MANFTKLFVVKSRNLVKELSIQEAGLIWKIIPYFHFSTYYLCENPMEKDSARHMSRKMLAEHVGHDMNTVGKLMNGLSRKGAVIITLLYGKNRYLINPDLMYRKSTEDEHAKHVRNLFKQHEQDKIIH